MRLIIITTIDFYKRFFFTFLIIFTFIDIIIFLFYLYEI